MENIEFDRLIYLTVLGTAIAGWFLAENRHSLGRTLRMALSWVLIFVGFVAAYGLWDDISADVMSRQTVLEDGQTVELPRRSDGHFHVKLELDGVPVDFLVDTGATDIVLTRADAARVGLDPENMPFFGTAQTANGIVQTAHGFVDEVSLGPVVFENVPVAVNSGDMSGSLLGMSYLSRFDRIEIAGDRMRLTP